MGWDRVSDKETNIDNRLRCGYSCSNSLDRGTHSGCDPKCGASAVLPRGLAIRAGAASGIRSFGITAETTGSSPVVTRKGMTRERKVPREMIAALAIATASGRRGRIAGRSANCGARSARRTSSRPQARDRARAMRRWPGKVEREAAHADGRDHATLSAYSAPLTPHTIAKWHATATFLRHPPGAGRLAAGLPLSYASIEI